MILYDLLKNDDNKAIAITSPQKTPLNYGDLRLHIKKIGRHLFGLGLVQKDRVAIVLPNGPEMATAFLAVASHMSAAPLNPAYKENEFNFYLKDLNPKIVLTEDVRDSAIIRAAKKLKIKVIKIKSQKNFTAGMFEIRSKEKDVVMPKEGDEALVLHTSGTTSKPKVVPLTHKNIVVSSLNISNSLELSNKDHCLNIMPLFHIHGLIAVIISSLSKGASVCCSGGFNAIKFIELALDEKITWYSGVPTMHQAILLRATRSEKKFKNLKLRFIRSSSASLPPAVFFELEKTFGCPIVEAYGMTEATHQMTSNPVGIGLQKPGFVGIVTKPDVCIMDGKGKALKNGIEGEICIKGENVTNGYENNMKANNESFFGNWFRTGDQGFLDEDGFLKITGRLKEIINRGGEKISPLELDNVLMEHGQIMQAVTFSIPDKMLGEEIAVALVKNENSDLTEMDVKKYVGEKVAKFKIPKKVFFLEEIPKGSTGKLQRLGLAKKLGI